MRYFRLYVWMVMLITLVTSCGGGVEKRHVSDWSVTLDPESEEPLGTKILVSALDIGNDSIPLQIIKYKNLSGVKNLKKNLLFVTNGKVPLEKYAEVLTYRSSKGYSTLVAANDFGPVMESVSHPFSISEFVEASSRKEAHISIRSEYGYGIYELPKSMCASHFSLSYTKVKDFIPYSYYKTLMKSKNGDLAYKFTPHNGAPILLVSVPLFFTNYSILCKENADLLFLLMDEASGTKQNEWAVCFVGDKQNDKNLYTYEGKNQYLRPRYISKDEKKMEFPDWLQTLLIIGIFISFLLLCARRRQRIVPYIAEPRNQTVDYAKQVSLNYFWRNEYRLILRKKYVVFKDVLQEKTHINLNDTEHMVDNVALLTKLTGMERYNLPGFFSRLQQIQNEDRVDVEWTEMKSKIDIMNQIISKLKK